MIPDECKCCCTSIMANIMHLQEFEILLLFKNLKKFKKTPCNFDPSAALINTLAGHLQGPPTMVQIRRNGWRFIKLIN